MAGRDPGSHAVGALADGGETMVLQVDMAQCPGKGVSGSHGIGNGDRLTRFSVPVVAGKEPAAITTPGHDQKVKIESAQQATGSIRVFSGFETEELKNDREFFIIQLHDICQFQRLPGNGFVIKVLAQIDIKQTNGIRWGCPQEGKDCLP